MGVPDARPRGGRREVDTWRPDARLPEAARSGHRLRCKLQDYGHDDQHLRLEAPYGAITLASRPEHVHASLWHTRRRAVPAETHQEAQGRSTRLDAAATGGGGASAHR